VSEPPERSGDRRGPASDGVGEPEGRSPSDWKDVFKFVSDLYADQTIEIERMEKMLGGAEKRGPEGVKG
jgi:hypothetical protein